MLQISYKEGVTAVNCECLYTHTPSGWCSSVLTNTRWKRVFLIPAVAVSSFVIHATEMEGGQGESMVTSHLLQGDLFQVL